MCGPETICVLVHAIASDKLEKTYIRYVWQFAGH